MGPWPLIELKDMGDRERKRERDKKRVTVQTEESRRGVEEKRVYVKD